ncbi:MAG: ATP-dependent DNA helicase RecQ [Prevotella sp.]|nr:ATP-dependent DNA helicase RecQ [Prevotella sp.]
MSFSKRIHTLGDSISFIGIRNIAVDEISTLSRVEQDRLYNELARGTQVLDDDAHLNMYLRCFGLMHKAKADEAFKNLPKLSDLFSKEIEIYDWGCGQGTATICLLDFLHNCGFSPKIKRINLVEPSNLAVNRSVDILSCYKEINNTEIRTVIKKFDDLEISDIESYNCRKLHLFSNILDVASFDLPKFTRLFQQTQKGGNYIVCVGPLNAGYKRIDWFVDAINPQYRYFSTDKPKGCWIEGKEWTISLRIVAAFIDSVEDIAIIRNRIENAKKHRQFFAGYVTDAVSDILANSDYSEQADELMAALSTFDVRSDKSLEQKENIDPVLAVMANIISRGLPTKAPLEIEELLSTHFCYSYPPLDKEHYYRGTDKCNAEDIFQALHLVDPRFTFENYNVNSLESAFESDFIQSYLPRHGKSYMSQVLEPQRNLSSIVDIPNRMFNKDRRVDFALEIPYSTESHDNHIGFVVEINGEQYHSSMTSRIKDARREQMITERRWDVETLVSINDSSVADDWESNKKYSPYLNIIKKNYSKELDGDWLNLLQFTLSPFAVARIERILVEAMINGQLKTSAQTWKIAIIERDVPCAQMAIDDIRDIYNHLCALKGTKDKLPEIELVVVSTPEFNNSPLHKAKHPKINQQISNSFDICIDISMLLRDKIANFPITIKADTYYVIRSSHYSQDTRNIYSAENIEYVPLVKKTRRGEYVDLPDRAEILKYFLQNIFRKDSFREGQLAILSRALSNKTTIGLLPTGGGKSLTYQLAAMLQPGVTIIVDPLISLMVDQYDGLVGQRIDVSACINSTMTREEKSYCLGKMERGEVQFMFLSPERFMMEDFREEILAMPRSNNVYFAYGVIDEVHTVSEWGHDFRPAYLQLGRNMTRFMETKTGENIPIIGLTATASYDVLADVERELTLGGQMALDSDAIVRPDISEREELTYRIVEIKADFTPLKRNNINVVNGSLWALRDCVAEAKRTYLIGLLGNTPNDIDAINSTNRELLKISDFDSEHFYSPSRADQFVNSGIIFCPYREGALGVLDKVKDGKLIKTGISTYVASIDSKYKVGTYLGGADPKLMKPFITNKQNFMVATKAFGMGIDKPNVRFTINITHPSSIESYVQEAGRGGRDKKVAISYLLYEPTELIDLSEENLADVFGMNIPAQYSWLNLYKDQYIEQDDLGNLCSQYRLTTPQIQQLHSLLDPYKINIDKDIQLYFHNNSFKGSYKERVILSELAYGVVNANILPQNNQMGVYAAMNGLNIGDYSLVEVHGENQLKEDYQQFRNLIINEVNNIATAQGWSLLPNTAFNNGELNEKNVPNFGALLKEISKASGNSYWRQYHRAAFMRPLEKTFCRRRDTDDTDKAIYRMCCIGLVDDVKIEYLDNDKHKYTLRVVKRSNGDYYNCLQSFFEKYYSTAQSQLLVNAARNHGAQTEIDNCLGYLTEFVYDKLEEKRRLSIRDMRDACVGGINRGDVWLKDFIHLYFNSKYAKDYHDVNGVNYSLRQDIRQPSVDLIMKYINVVNVDPSGPVVTNAKHLYGAVLIILRDQLTDELASSILYLLRSYCLAFLGIGENTTLIDEFKVGYWENGLRKLVKVNDGNNPQELKQLIDNYNQAILKDAKDDAIKQFIRNKETEIVLSVVTTSYISFSDKYLN